MKPRKKLVRTVNLRFFEDNNGVCGLTHEDTMQGDESFDAVWDGLMMFHDNFEHAHEHIDPHFRGTAAMNIGGEIAAMGTLWYYYNDLGFNDRLNSNYHSPDEMVLSTTVNMMNDAIVYGNMCFGYTLESACPDMPESDDTMIEWLIQEHYDRVQDMVYKGTNEDEAEASRIYKDSVTLQKLQNLYRYGYEMARKLYPGGHYRNGLIMQEFKEYWDAFCKANNAEEMGNLYRGITFKLYRDTDRLCHWTAVLNPQYGVKQVILKGGPDGVPERKYIMMDDVVLA